MNRAISLIGKILVAFLCGKGVTTEKYVGYLTKLSGGAAYPAVKPIHFKESQIIVPTKELIRDYENKFGGTLELTWNLQIQNQRLKQARDILLPRLMMGMVDVDELSR